MKGTLVNDLYFIKSPSTRLVGFCDSDFAKDANDHKLVIGFVFFWVIIWKCGLPRSMLQC